MFIIVNLALCPHTPVLSLAICQYSFKCNSKPGERFNFTLLCIYSHARNIFIVSLMECPSDEMGPIPHWEVSTETELLPFPLAIG